MEPSKRQFGGGGPARLVAQKQLAARYFSASVCFFVALLLTVAGASVSTARAEVNEISPFEIGEYQRDFNVSAAQAEETLKAQRRGNRIVTRLKLVLGDDYAGVWFDNAAGEFVVPLLPDADSRPLRSLFKGLGLAGDYRIVGAAYGWSELQDGQDRLDEELRLLIGKGLVQTAVDPRMNAVVIREAQGTGPATEAVIERAATESPVNVRIRREPNDILLIVPRACTVHIGSRYCDRPLRGGVAIEPNPAKEGGYRNNGLCTAGFKATGNGAGNRFILTAGHCVTSVTHWMTQTTGLEEKPIGEAVAYTYPNGDWAAILANGSYWDTEIWPTLVSHFWEDQTQNIDYEGSSYVGQYVCHSGNRTGTSCGNVLELDITGVVGEEEEVPHLTEFGEVCVTSGDSGGPVFAGDTAMGIMQGKEPGEGNECPPGSGNNWGHDGYYIEITEATAALDVRVAPADTLVSASVKQALNGSPGWVTVGGNVYSGNREIDNKYVNVNFSKWEGGEWVYKNTAQAVITDNRYQVDNWQVGKGSWRVRSVFPEQEPYAEAESDFHEFRIEDGYHVIARHSGKCLSVVERSTSNGAKLHQWTCRNPLEVPSQVFTLAPKGSGYYELIARHSGRCVDVTGASTSDGVQLQQWSCYGSNNQQWDKEPVSGEPSWAALIAKHSGKCMDVYAASESDGAKVVQWTCKWPSNQQWKVKSVESSLIQPPTSLSIDLALHGQPGYVSVSGSVDAAGYDVEGEHVNINFSRWEDGQWVYKSTIQPTLDSYGNYDYDHWGVSSGEWRAKTVYPGGDPPLTESQSAYQYFEIKKGYRFIMRHSGKCLSVSENSGSDGAAIVQWTCNSNPSPNDGQVFTLAPMGGGYYEVQANSSGKCFDVANGSTADGARIQQWSCHGGANQQWDLVPISDQPPWQAFVVKHSGKCLDVYAASESDGAKVVQWTCKWPSNQQWKWEAIN